MLLSELPEVGPFLPAEAAPQCSGMAASQDVPYMQFECQLGLAGQWLVPCSTLTATSHSAKFYACYPMGCGSCSLLQDEPDACSLLVDLEEKNWYKVHAATYVQVGISHLHQWPPPGLLYCISVIMRSCGKLAATTRHPFIIKKWDMVRQKLKLQSVLHGGCAGWGEHV